MSIAVKGAIEAMDERFSTQQLAANKRAAQMAEPSKTLLAESQNVSEIVKHAEDQSARLDISTLKPGDIIEGRYKYHREHRQRRLRHRAADGGYGRR